MAPKSIIDIILGHPQLSVQSIGFVAFPVQYKKIKAKISLVPIKLSFFILVLLNYFFNQCPY